jgi:hypothetical protein
LSVFITLFLGDNESMSSMIKGIFITLMMVFAAAPSWSLSEGRLLSQSSSGQTALFNLGVHDGIKEGDFAVIVKEIRRLDTPDLRIVPVAKAKNIKLGTTSSVWILYKVFDAELLVNGQAYLILTESQMLNGRRDPRFGRISVVTETDKAAIAARSVLQEDKDRLSKLKSVYPEVQPLHEREKRQDGDGELVDVEGWKKFRDQRYRTALYKSPHTEDFQRELRLATFEKIVTAYLQKVNDPKFSYDKFYDEQKKSDLANEIRVRSSFDTEYENFLSDQAQRAVEDAKLYRVILEKGDSWSEEFSDEELKVILRRISILQEKDRRGYVLAEPKRYSALLNFGMNLTDAQNQKDSNFRRDGNYSIEGEFEATPFLKHETLERFTLFGSVRQNRSAFQAQNRNVSLDELSVSAGINWYPVYPAHAFGAPGLFFGTYIRTGFASAQAVSAKEKANYTVLTLPGFRAGMRYNFRNNLGLRIAFSVETLQLDRYEQSKFNSVLPNQTRLVEGKMNFAISYSF